MPEIRTRIDDEDGRYRAVVEVEVPGTPEEIWELIATGPGVETWFVPAEVEPRMGGRYVTHHGDYGDSEGVITAWDPPRRIAYDEADWQGPDKPVPVWNTEILVESVSGDTCVVRLSSGFLAGGDEWQDDIKNTLDGWNGALRNLWLYRKYFAGLPVTTMLVQQELPGAVELPDAAALAGLRVGKVGDPVITALPVPHLRGVLENVDGDIVIVRTTEPMAGLAEMATIRYAGVASMLFHWYLFGEEGPAVRDRERPRWEAWASGLVADGASESLSGTAKASSTRV